MAKMKMSIVIDGDSVDELFAIGPRDLLQTFLPDRFDVDPKDVVHIMFQEDLTADEFGEHIMGNRSRTIHKDNYFRDKDDDKDENS